MDTNRLPKQALQYKPKGRRNPGTAEEEVEGPTSSWGLRNRITLLTLQEHDDDDELLLLQHNGMFSTKNIRTVNHLRESDKYV